jgi:hypothetical protein
MIELIISYFLHSDEEEAESQLLGVESYQGIKEKLIPDYSAQGHKVTITKFFEGYDDHRWLVKGLDHASITETSIYLEPRVNNRQEEFLSQTKKSNRSVISKLQFGTLVEVEFGYIPLVKKSNGDVRGNKRYPDTVHKGEMHKRRLCIIVKADSSRVQVVPITSQEPNSLGDLSIFEISSASLRSLIGYKNPDILSYGICRMIKTVSVSRILPPLAIQSRTTSAYRDIRYSKKLNGVDQKAFKESLSHAVGLTDYYDLKEKVGEYYQELVALKADCDSLSQQVEQLTEEKVLFEELKNRHDALLEIITDWRMGASEDSPEKARVYIENEVAEYLAILNEV